MSSSLREGPLRWLLLFLSALAASASAGGDHAGDVAYIRGGDVWTKQLPGGREKQLTTGGNVQSPQWSPTGRWLSYRKGPQLWVVRRSGRDAKALNGGKPVGNWAWSPVADTLVYTIANGGVAISFVGEGEDGYLAAPAHAENSSNHGLSWSPDGQWVAYVLQRGPDSPLGKSAELWQVRHDGHSALLATTEGPDAAGMVPAAWSGDSKKILYWLAPGFSGSVQADGLPLKVISTAGEQTRDLGVKTLLYPDWIAPAPHSEHILVVEGAGRESWTNKHLALVDLAKAKVTILSDPKMAVASPKWSLDGERIVYSAAPDAGKLTVDKAKAALFHRHIYVIGRSGLGRVQLTRDPLYRDEYPLWDADASELLFARLDKAGHASLWTMHADGSELRKVVDSLTPGPDPFGNNGHVSWSDVFDWRRPAAAPVSVSRPKTLPAPPLPVPRSGFRGPSPSQTPSQ
jgi:Tol biopolymer transport system component